MSLFIRTPSVNKPKAQRKKKAVFAPHMPENLDKDIIMDVVGDPTGRLNAYQELLLEELEEKALNRFATLLVPYS